MFCMGLVITRWSLLLHYSQATNKTPSSSANTTKS